MTAAATDQIVVRLRALADHARFKASLSMTGQDGDPFWLRFGEHADRACDRHKIRMEFAELSSPNRVLPELEVTELLAIADALNLPKEVIL